MASLNPLKWFKKDHNGTFVEVHMDYGFGKLLHGVATGKSDLNHCLHITDLPLEKAIRCLHNQRLDWKYIKSQWRHKLEIDGYLKATWKDVQEQLK